MRQRREQRSGRDRIQDGDRAELALTEALASRLVEDAAPGFFVGGRSIVGTSTYRDQASGQRVFVFRFDDGSSLTLAGEFTMEFSAAIPGVALEHDDAVKAGNALMSGEEVIDVEGEELPDDDAR